MAVGAAVLDVVDVAEEDTVDAGVLTVDSPSAGSLSTSLRVTGRGLGGTGAAPTLRIGAVFATGAGDGGTSGRSILGGRGVGTLRNDKSKRGLEGGLLLPRLGSDDDDRLDLGLDATGLSLSLPDADDVGVDMVDGADRSDGADKTDDGVLGVDDPATSATGADGGAVFDPVGAVDC
jgi:hypothetical protein